MNQPTDDPQSRLRWSVYTLLIALSVGALLGRILAVNAVDRLGTENYLVSKELSVLKKDLAAQGLPPEEIDRRLKVAEPALREKLKQQRPFLSANDRSRWTTMRSLVEHGTYEIDEIIAQPGWDTIDMVRHADREGELRLYSSKPPLLATLMAIPYWVIYRLTGWTLATHPYEIGRILLILFNVVPLVVYFYLLAKFAERFGRTDWGRIFIVGAACFGTFLTTFAVVINNHLPAAVSSMIALYCAVRIWYDDERRGRYFIVCGLFSAFTAACELPALSFFALLSAGLLWKAPRHTLAAYVPAAAVVMAAFFITNKIAHDSWRLPYMHRSKVDPADDWYDYEYTRKDGRVIQSYWRTPVGIDRGEESAARYVLHVLIGHHGIFSLTPIWLLTIPGLVVAARRYGLRDLAIFIAVLSLVCIAFYLKMEQIDRNYGGMTSGFRWVFWFAPMWLMGMLPAVDAAADSRWQRWLTVVLLVISVLSASYPTWNPWTHPWLMNLYLHIGWAQL